MRVRLMFGIVLPLLALSAVWAQSGPTATVSWNPPVTYTDGTPINSSDLDHYTLVWTASAAGGPSGGMTIPVGTFSTVVPFACGSANFILTVTTSSTSKYPNILSGPTSPVLFDSKVACAPNPPSGLAVQSLGAKS